MWGETWDPFSYSPFWSRPAFAPDARMGFIVSPLGLALLAMGAMTASAFAAGLAMGYSLGAARSRVAAGGRADGPVIDGEWSRR